jgi:EpsD family peptidyl-prolyl cis-trans isomerase
MALALVACGESKKDGSGQALVNVDGTEVTIHQLNTELSKTGGQQATKQLLDALVARQLFVNAAKKAKMDSDPNVLAELERSRDLVLAQAYIQSKAGSIARPTRDEIENFYRQNPDWFGQRKQYDFYELVINGADMSPELNTLMGTPRPIEEVATWLEAKRINFTRLQVSKTTAELPAPMVAGLKTLSRGGLFVVNEGSSAVLASLMDVKNVPLTLIAATPQIEQYLIGQKQSQATEVELNRLKAEAKIEFFDKAKSLKDLTAQNPGAAATAAPAAAKDSAIGRGLSGLK